MSFSQSIFEPQRDWDAVYTKSASYHFGEEPSQLAQTALRYFQALGGQPETAVALDLGSGEGRDTAFLAASGLRVVARDVSPVGLQKTLALLDRRAASVERVDLALGDAREFDYPQNTYDLALAANIYQFLPPAEVPRHIERLQLATKPGGICAVGVFSPAMATWGVSLDGFFAATADELLTYFPNDAWRLLDRTEYWTYRPATNSMSSFSYVVAQKQELPK